MVCSPAFVSSVIDFHSLRLVFFESIQKYGGVLAALLSWQACFLEQEGKGSLDRLVCAVAMSEMCPERCCARALLNRNNTSLPRNEGPGAAFLAVLDE